MDKRLENNQAELIGKIVSKFRFSHKVYGEEFYVADIEMTRLSGTADVIQLLCSDRLIDVKNNVGLYVHVFGQFRSFSRYEENKNRLILTVFVREMEVLDEHQVKEEINTIFLEGYLCREPIYRKTPLGREIADLLIAVNRSYGKSDYIPCICWGRNARFASGFEVGGHVAVLGRIQSREYIKRMSETETVKRIAYEVSISKLEVI